MAPASEQAAAATAKDLVRTRIYDIPRLESLAPANARRQAGLHGQGGSKVCPARG